MSDEKNVQQTVKAAQPSVSARPLIYVGPNLIKRGLITYMTFRDGVPSFITDDTLKKLIVPASELTKAQQDVAKKGTLLHTYYVRAQKLAVERSN